MLVSLLVIPLPQGVQAINALIFVIHYYRYYLYHNCCCFFSCYCCHYYYYYSYYHYLYYYSKGPVISSKDCGINLPINHHCKKSRGLYVLCLVVCGICRLLSHPLLFLRKYIIFALKSVSGLVIQGFICLLITSFCLEFPCYFETSLTSSLRGIVC